MLRRTFLFGLAAVLGLTGCGDSKMGERGPVTVVEVIDNIHRWDGHIYRIRGWLGSCKGLDCAIYASRDDAQIVADGDYNSDQWLQAMNSRLSIASIGDFDDRVGLFQFTEVELIALVSAECSGWNGVCTDRVPDLYPFSIIPINPVSEAE